MEFMRIKRKLNERTYEEGISLLKNERRAVLSMFGLEGYPYAIPVNFFYNEENNRIYFHGARAGHKVNALKANDKVCFTVYGNESIKAEEWAPFMQSVIIFGKCHLMEHDEKAIEICRKFAEKYYPSAEAIDEAINEGGKYVQMFEIEIDHMSVKEVQEK